MFPHRSDFGTVRGKKSRFPSHTLVSVKFASQSWDTGIGPPRSHSTLSKGLVLGVTKSSEEGANHSFLNNFYKSLFELKWWHLPGRKISRAPRSHHFWRSICGSFRALATEQLPQCTPCLLRKMQCHRHGCRCRTPAFKSQLCNLLVRWLNWRSHFTSLCLGFLIRNERLLHRVTIKNLCKTLRAEQPVTGQK